MGNWLIIIVLCTLHCATHLVAEEELLDSVDSVTTEALLTISNSSGNNTQDSIDNTAINNDTVADISAKLNQTNIVDDKNSSASFNYEFDNRTVVEKPTIPPQLLNVSIGEQQELEEVTKEIIEATTTANTKIKKIITNTTGTEFTWEVFEEDGNAKSGADAKTGADAKGEVGARNEADENDIVPTTTQEPDEMIQILQASGPYNFSIEGTPVSLAQTMRDTLQYMRNANPAIRHQLFRRYKIKRQPIKGKNCRDEHLIPCNFGVGRDCNMLLLPTGCFVCTCPYKSPARGCLGPAEMSPKRVETLLNGTKTCDSGAKAQVVDRYIRVVDLKGIDDCIPTKQPYCDFLEDVNTYRMPRSKQECFYHCFSDRELKARNIHV